ncbi:hypothetical protein FRC00_014233, partial [Tulasnella sp. 408]
EEAAKDDAWIGESPKADVYNESAVAPTPGPALDLSSWKFPSSSPSSPTYRSKAPPPLNPFVREDSVGPHQQDILAPPFTPSPSCSEDGRASSPHSGHSRSSSLNANAAVFSPTRYCPLTPRSPCSSNGGRSRNGSVSGSPGAQVAEGSPEYPLYSRRHSLALAAWEAAQRRMSTQNSETKSEQAMYSPTAPLSAQSWAPGATYADTQAWMNVASPTHSRASSESLGKGGSGSLAAGATYDGSNPGSTGRKASTSSSAGAQSAVFSSFTASDYYAARRVSLPPAIANVHAQYGMDPAVDQLADLGHLIHAEGNYETSLASPPILEDLSARDIMRMENAIVQPRPVRRSTRLTEGWVAEQNGRSKRRSPLTPSSELEA